MCCSMLVGCWSAVAGGVASLGVCLGVCCSVLVAGLRVCCGVSVAGCCHCLSRTGHGSIAGGSVTGLGVCLGVWIEKRIWNLMQAVQ